MSTLIDSDDQVLAIRHLILANFVFIKLAIQNWRELESLLVYKDHWGL